MEILAMLLGFMDYCACVFVVLVCGVCGIYV